MYFNNIDYPIEIIRAANEGNLVVFAGAGVSVNAPTCLPNFTELVNEIALTAGRTYDADECKEDEFLGDLERDDIDTHSIIAARLGDEQLEPNDFHANILRLFKSDNDIRVVTTNQDLMFEAAAEKAGININQIYTAPALPLGDDFCGIVHLHGSAKVPRNMIMTDSDFGKAYMLQGFATRFLVDMFRRYVVLFIGYSYNDPIVRYLTTSIPQENIENAFITSCAEDLSKIRRTGFKVIRFTEGKYDTLCESLGKIGLYNRRGLFDWETRITGLDLSMPPSDWEVRDEILDGLKTPGAQKLLASSITNKAWVSWFDNNGLLNNLFDSNIALNDTDLMWANWLIDNCFYDEIIFTLIKHKNAINHVFCEKILVSFKNNDENHTDDIFRRFLALFLDRTDLNRYIVINLFEIANERKMYDIYWDLFIYICDYRIVAELNPFYDLDSDKKETFPIFNYKMSWKIPSHVIEQMWEMHVSKHLFHPVEALFQISNLIKQIVHDIENEAGCNQDTFAINNIDIEGNPHNLFKDNELRVLCRVIDYCFDIVCAEQDDISIRWINNVIEDSNPPILRRLGLKKLRNCDRLSSNEKLIKLLDNFSLHETFEKEQIFLLIAECYSQADVENQDTVLDKVCISVSSNSNEADMTASAYYEVFNWLQWIKKHGGKSDRIENKLSEIHDKYPYFEIRQSPELDIYSSVDIHYDDSPLSKQQLFALNNEERFQIISASILEAHSTYDRYGLMNQITLASQEDFAWAAGLAEDLLDRECWNEHLWEAIIRGIHNHPLDYSKFIEFVSIIKKIPSHILVKEKADFLNHSFGDKDINSAIDEIVRKDLFDFIKVLWDNRSDESLEGSWMLKTLNSSTGKLSMALIRLSISKEKQDLNESYLNTFIKSYNYNPLETEEFICALLLFASVLYSRDAKWVERVVLSLLDSDNDSIHMAAWEGFIYGNSNYSLQFAETLLPIMHRNFSGREGFTDEMNQSFINGYVVIFTNTVENPIVDYVNPVIKAGYGELFADNIDRLLQYKGEKWIDEIWKTWLKQYWINRNNNMPCKLSSDEISKMLSWIENIPDAKGAVDLFTSIDVGEISVAWFLISFSKDPFVQNHPNEAADLLVFLWKHRNRAEYSEFLFKDSVQVLLDKEISKDKKEELKKIFLSIT